MTTIQRVPAIECTPWCRFGDGHPDDWCAEDQTCYGEPHRIPASVSGDETCMLTVVAHRSGRDRLQNVCLNVYGEDVDCDVYLTVDQARLLIESLTAVTDQLEGNPGGQNLTT